MTIDWVENLVRQMANYPAAEVFDVVEVGGPGGPDEYRDFIVVGARGSETFAVSVNVEFDQNGEVQAFDLRGGQTEVSPTVEGAIEVAQSIATSIGLTPESVKGDEAATLAALSNVTGDEWRFVKLTLTTTPVMFMALDMRKRGLAPKDIADDLSISVDAVYEAVRRGELAVYRIGRRIVIPPDAVDEWLEAVYQPVIPPGSNRRRPF